jgi:hypothetical protein
MSIVDLIKAHAWSVRFVAGGNIAGEVKQTDQFPQLSTCRGSFAGAGELRWGQTLFSVLVWFYPPYCGCTFAN